ncbi:MAG: hypothetical protein WAZ20_10625, partial [Methanothrix sp.]
MGSFSEKSGAEDLNNIIYSAIVSIQGNKIVAKDVEGHEITSGVAGTDDSRVLTEAIDSVPNN